MVQMNWRRVKPGIVRYLNLFDIFPYLLQKLNYRIKKITENNFVKGIKIEIFIIEYVLSIL